MERRGDILEELYCPQSLVINSFSLHEKIEVSDQLTVTVAEKPHSPQNNISGGRKHSLVELAVDTFFVLWSSEYKHFTYMKCIMVLISDAVECMIRGLALAVIVFTGT